MVARYTKLRSPQARSVCRVQRARGPPPASRHGRHVSLRASLPRFEGEPESSCKRAPDTPHPRSALRAAGLCCSTLASACAAPSRRDRPETAEGRLDRARALEHGESARGRASSRAGDRVKFLAPTTPCRPASLTSPGAARLGARQSGGESSTTSRLGRGEAGSDGRTPSRGRGPRARSDVEYAQPKRPLTGQRAPRERQILRLPVAYPTMNSRPPGTLTTGRRAAVVAVIDTARVGDLAGKFVSGYDFISSSSVALDAGGAGRGRATDVATTLGRPRAWPRHPRRGTVGAATNNAPARGGR
jgi:hypothetical protein